MKQGERRKEWSRERGRLEKKLEEQRKELERLRRREEELLQGVLQTQMVVDALLTAVTLEHGTAEKGEKRLTLSAFDLEQLRRDYEIQACRGEKGYVLTVRERGTGDEKSGENAEG